MGTSPFNGDQVLTTAEVTMTCFPFSNNRRCWETYQPLTGMLAIGLDNYMANYLNAASKNV
jgi:hypothetical protein